MAATKSDLARAGAEGRFRADLYYRLNVATLAIPPLRERRDDVAILFFHLAREARARYRREIPELSPELEAELRAHDWPGNVRELRNVADRFVLGLWRGFGTAPAGTGDGSASSGALADRVAAFERSVIEAELRRSGGRMRPVYEALQISRKGLYDKMQRLGLAVPEDG